MKKPYIKKLSTISHIKIWFVDGNWIRTNLDEEFTNFALYHKKSYNYIPKDEFWIDHETKEGEEHFYIDNLLALHKFLQKGVKWKDAVERADEIERKERLKSKLAEKLKNLKR